jgi:hypothetical protein
MTWSIGLGVLGVCGTGWWIVMRNRQQHPWPSTWSWFLGLVALFPAWLLAFLGLLGTSLDPHNPATILPPPALFSSGAGLLGVVGTDAALRRLLIAGRNIPPVLAWLIGIGALLPAWGLALYGLWRR